MPLRIRAIVLSALAALAVMGIAIGVATNILIHRFDAIEAGQVSEKAMQAVRAIEADLNQLAVSTRDYAEWDDAQHYVANRNPEFLQANFSVDSLSGMQVDQVALLDNNGAALFATQLSDDGSALISGLPTGVLDTVRSLQHETKPLRAKASSSRILQTQWGLLAFSIVEISRSDHTGANGAALFFGRFIRSDELQRMRETSQLPIVISNLGDDRSFLSPALGDAVRAAGTGHDVAPITNDAQHMTGFATIRDWSGKPLALVSVTEPRDIGMLGRRTTHYLMGSIGVLAIVCAGVLLAMLLRLREQWSMRLQMKAQQERILACVGESIVVARMSDGRIIEANDALQRTLDYSRKDLLQLSLTDIFVDLPAVGELIGSATSAAPRECQIRGRSNQLLDTEITATTLQDGEASLVCIVARDLSHRRQAEQTRRESQTRLAHLAEHDALTGLPNRQYLQTRFAALLHQMSATDQSLALIYLDLDNFKNVNDSRGHGFGDQILKTVAIRLTENVSPEDMVLRMGGDEFVIVAPLHNRSVREIAHKLLTLLREPINVENSAITLTASIGVAVYPQDGLDGESLLKHADIALYQAKEHGRNCHQEFARDMNLQLSEHVLLEQALRRALNTSQIRIEYQPIVDLHTGLLVSFEALARWQHPELGPIPPGRFIPVAEKSGLIVELGEQIVRDVIRQLHDWSEAGLTLAPVAINVAPIQFERTDFTTFVHETAMQYNVDLNLLAFEVTESSLMQTSPKHVVMMDTLRHAGSRVYIDDFGTGFSNLSYLKTLPVDAVKIDQSFVRTILTDASDVTIVRSIVAVARQLRMDTVAEGIESAEQAEKLRELGCKFGQGYYFSKPMPAAHCRALLEQLGVARRFTETVKVRAFRQAAG